MEPNKTQKNMETEMTNSEKLMPGAFLAFERENRGITIEYIAGKLNLRTQVLQYLEADEYHLLPQPVFVNGYIRAYCKLLDIHQVDELIQAYAINHPQEVKMEKTLYQNSSPTEVHTEHWLHWVTVGLTVITITAVGLWWFQNKGTEDVLSQSWRQAPKSHKNAMVEHEANMNLTDISKMRQMLNYTSDNEPLTVKSAD